LRESGFGWEQQGQLSLFAQGREQRSRAKGRELATASPSKWRTRSRERRAKGKKWSNLGKMLRAHTRRESDLETMKELINTIVQKTGISQEDAQKTVQVVFGFLKTKMPAPFAAQLDSFLSGSGLPQQTGVFPKSKVGEMVGAKA
jgi:hypothetical protein